MTTIDKLRLNQPSTNRSTPPSSGGRLLGGLTLAIALGVGLGAADISLVTPAYSQSQTDEHDCTPRPPEAMRTTSEGASTPRRIGELARGCQLRYDVVTDPGTEAVTATYDLTYRPESGQPGFDTRDPETGFTTVVVLDDGDFDDQTDDVFRLASDPETTITIEPGAPVGTGNRVRDVGSAARDAVRGVVGHDAIAIGSSPGPDLMNDTADDTRATVKGIRSIAIGSNAQVGRVIPAQEAVGGLYDLTYQPQRGEPGYEDRNDAGFVTVRVLDDARLDDNNADEFRLASDPTMRITIEPGAPVGTRNDVVRNPRAATPQRVEPVSRSIAIGGNARVTGNDGIAIGDAAEAGENAIAIGTAEDEGAEANQIRIGNGQSDVQIGAYDLQNINTRTNTNARSIATNARSIATNADHIQTNRAGIAGAIALANLPTVTGPRGGWGIALGSFDSETAVAIGANFAVGSNGTIKFGASISDGETGVGIGYGMGF